MKGTHPFIFVKGRVPFANMKGRVPFGGQLRDLRSIAGLLVPR